MSNLWPMGHIRPFSTHFVALRFSADRANSANSLVLSHPHIFCAVHPFFSFYVFIIDFETSNVARVILQVVVKSTNMEEMIRKAAV